MKNSRNSSTTVTSCEEWVVQGDGKSKKAKLLGMVLKRGVLGMIKDKFNELFRKESLTWSLYNAKPSV